MAPYPGLTERETPVLRALRDLGQAPAEELARRSTSSWRSGMSSLH
ncbi:MAG TPA: hypothetical protein VKF37_11580 [Chloroflexota bacterium]|nr:hypothetical protein [Chloroflexota bacterium]